VTLLFVYYTDAGNNADYHFFMPSVQVKSFDDVPEGLDCFTFQTSLCARLNFMENKKLKN